MHQSKGYLIFLALIIPMLVVVTVVVMWQIDRFYALAIIGTLLIVFAPLGLALWRSHRATRELGDMSDIERLSEEDFSGEREQ